MSATDARIILDEPPIVDDRDRPLRDLRLSITDRCNLRCRYCMPEDEYTWLPRTDILSVHEVGRLVDVFASLGVDKVRITGGEPLLRRDVTDLVKLIAAQPLITDIAMTTNGVLLAPKADSLRAAGLHRVTVSLDTLDPERFARMSQRSGHAQVLDGLRALTKVGFTGTKIDAVVIRDMNDDELGALIEFGTTVAAEVRFIEYMDVGGATGWRSDLVVTRDEMLHRIVARYGDVEPLATPSSAPARRFALPDGRVFGIVSSTSNPFCSTCDRSRVTADGFWYQCLYAHAGTDLRTALRSGSDLEELRALIANGWRARRDQGAVDRLAVPGRGVQMPVSVLKRDPHLEMHVRGG